VTWLAVMYLQFSCHIVGLLPESVATCRSSVRESQSVAVAVWSTVIFSCCTACRQDSRILPVVSRVKVLCCRERTRVNSVFQSRRLQWLDYYILLLLCRACVHSSLRGINLRCGPPLYASLYTWCRWYSGHAIASCCSLFSVEFLCHVLIIFLRRVYRSILASLLDIKRQRYCLMGDVYFGKFMLSGQLLNKPVGIRSCR